MIKLAAPTTPTDTRPGIRRDCLRRTGQVVQEGILVLTVRGAAKEDGKQPWGFGLVGGVGPSG